MKRILLICSLFLLHGTGIFGQTLTITSTGETGTSGTNWSISGNTLTVTGTAAISASVIESSLSTGALAIQGNTSAFAVTFNQDINSTSSNALTVGSASNAGTIIFNNAIQHAGSITVFGGVVSTHQDITLSGTGNLTITSTLNTVLIGAVDINGLFTVNAGGNFVMGINITTGIGQPITADGGFIKTGSGTSYLSAAITTSNADVTIAGPIEVANFSSSSSVLNINTGGGDITIPGAVSAFSGNGLGYTGVVYANLYDASGGAVSGSTTDIYIRYNAGNQSFSGLAGMPSSFSVQYLLVAGGGGGGGSSVGVYSGGGGGGGGVADGTLTFTSGNTLNLVIGAGGVGGAGNCCINGTNGGETGISNLSLWVGGGGGGGHSNLAAGNVGTGNNNVATAGRSYLAGGGGGGSGRQNFTYPAGGTGTQYTQGGSGTQTSFGDWSTWGGGGGGAVNAGRFFGDLGYGGSGRTSSITGSSVEYGAGSGPRDRTNTIGSGGSSNSTSTAAVNGSNGTIILRFAIPTASATATATSALHLNAQSGAVSLGSTVASLTSLQITAGAASSITGVVSGSGSLTKSGTGTLTLSANNTYTGTTTISDGTLKLGIAGTSPNSPLGTIAGGTVITSGGALDLAGFTLPFAEAVTISGTGVSAGGAILNSTSTAVTFSGNITLAGNASIVGGAGDLTLSGTINGGYDLTVTTTNKAYTQSGIVGGTTALSAYTVNTGTGVATVNVAVTVAGPITLDGGQISMGGNKTSTLTNAAITVRAKTHIIHSAATTVTTQGGNVLLASNVDDATDGESLVNGYILYSYGLTINTNGGHITMGGGDLTGGGYATGASVYPYEGLRIDGTVNFNSSGGNIIMKGKSYAISTTSGAWGMGFWSLTTGTINSGTGTITLDGLSQSRGGTYNAGLFSNGNLTLTSANTTADAIKLIGKSTGIDGQSWGIEMESAFSAIASGTGGGINISTSQQCAGDNFDAVFRGETNILANGGAIQMLGKQDGGIANGRLHIAGNTYIGSKAASAVTASSSNVNIQYDKFDFPSGLRYMATTGQVTFQPASASFGQTVYSSWFNWNQNSQTMTSFTMGKVGNTGDITHESNNVTVAGPVAMYGGNIALNAGLITTPSTSTMRINASGNITTGASRTFQTNNNQILLWADNDGNSTGYIALGNDNIFNTANGSTSGNLTGGGKLIMAGGSTTDTDGNPTGYAITSAGTGVNLGSGFTAYTGGGDLFIKGRSTATSGTNYGLYATGAITINAGQGQITLEGMTSASRGLQFSGSGVTVIQSAKTSGTGISLTGTTTAANEYGIVFDNASNKDLATTGGAEIRLNGTGTGTGYGVYVVNTRLLASSGAIVVDGGVTGTTIATASTFGRLAGTSVTSSTSNVTLIGDRFNMAAALSVASSGQFSIQPYSNSFTSALSYPITNLGLSSDVSGLTIGKSTNTANVTVGSATSIAGPISIYGGTITLNGNLTSTASGDIIFYSDAALGSLASARTITTSGAFKYMPNSTSFSAGVSFPIANLSLANITGLQLGKSGNTANINIISAAQASGPITIYGGTVTLGANLTTLTSGDISIYSDNSLSVSSSRTATAAGMFKYMPNGTSFASAVSYPVGNLTVSSNGLQLGKPGNTAALTITGASSSNGPVSVFTGDFTTAASATLTATSSALEVTASGNVTLNAALAGSSTTVNVQGNLQTIGTLTNVNLTGGNAQTITGTATLNNLTLNKTSGTATLTSSRQDLTGTLTLTSGTLAAGGFLTLKSNASGTARVASHGLSTGTVTGNVVVERFIPSTGSRKKQWRMMGFPYSAAITPGDVSGIGISYSGSQTMMLFNENNDNGVYGNSTTRNGGYAPLGAASAPIAAGRGVATWIYGDHTATPATGTLGADLTISSQGPLNESGGDVTIAGVTNAVKGWNLVGNPFASTIDWNLILAASTNVASTLYRWDPQLEGWSQYNQSGGSIGASASQYIESGGGFFIKAATEGNNIISLVIPQSAKDANNAPNLHFTKAPFRLNIPGERIGPASTLAGLRVKASGMGNPIPAEAYLDVSKVDATKGWDPKYDGWMMSRSAGANIYFDGAADDDFSMQFDAPLTTGEQRYYPLAVTTPALGETTIEINSEGRWSNMHSVALIDQKAGKTILMEDGMLKYKFKLEELKSEGRFLLAINHIKLDADGQLPGFEVKALGNPVTGNTIDLLLTHPTASAKAWRVIDITGREAGVGTFAKDAGIQHRLTVPGMRNPGVYVVQVTMDNGETQQLRILKN
jgi:Passenger-associated-transport-repeat